MNAVWLRNFSAWMLVATCSWITASIADAHPISLSSAIVDVGTDKIDVKLEIMLEDLVLYHELSAGEDRKYRAEDLHRAAEKHGQFLAKYFTLRDGRGTEIPMEVSIDDRSEITTEGVDQTEIMLRTIRYQAKARPNQPVEFLTVMQEFGGPDAVLPAVTDLMMLQNGVLLERPVQIAHGRPHTVPLDWQNPPAEARGGLAGLRRQYEEQFRKRLGITSYGGLYSYLYVTPFEVRHEILIPLLTLEQWLPIERSEGSFLEVAEQESAGRLIEQFFQDHGTLEINGQSVSPRIARIQFFGLDASDFAINAPARRLSVYQARLGIILRYRTDDPVNQIEMNWDLFNDYAPFMRTVVLVDQFDPSNHLFSPEESSFSWQRDTPLSLPRIQPIPGASAMIDPARLPATVKQLLVNIYRSFEFQEDSDVYDALAASASESFLPELYLQIKRALVMAEQGGDLSRIHDLEIISASAEDTLNSDKKSYRCRWRAVGTIEHWGHIHRRVNEYEANLLIQSESGFIRLDGMQLLETRNIEIQTLLRQQGPGN